MTIGYDEYELTMIPSLHLLILNISSTPLPGAALHSGESWSADSSFAALPSASSGLVKA
jgi:hypothetical protein